MKNIVIILFCCFMIVSCDDRRQFLKDLNGKPVITLQSQRGGGQTKLLIDSVKTSNSTLSYAPFKIFVGDANNNIRGVTMQVFRGSGKLFYKDEIIDSLIPVTGDEGIYKFIPNTPSGQIAARFIVSDQFGFKDSAIMQITAFSNLPPVAGLYTVQTRSNDIYDCSLDASTSYDPDAAFGGTITKYVFTVNSEKIQSIAPEISYIFPTPGTYTVKLQVLDNDNTLSKEVTQNITVQ